MLWNIKQHGTGAIEPVLKICVLGGFAITANGQLQGASLKRKTTKAVLAFFLLHPGSSFTWEEIVVKFWPDSTAKSAHQMLKRAIWEIHRCSPALKSLIVCNKYQYSLKPQAAYAIDAIDFQDLIEKAGMEPDGAEKSKLLERALDIYNGILLPGCYFDWVNELRNNLENQCVAALDALANWHYAQENYKKCVILCQKRLEIDELEEKAHRLLMAAHLRLNQPVQAIKQYKILVKILRENFDKEPSAETESLKKSLY